MVAFGENSEVLVGEVAHGRMASRPQEVAREFKRRLGDPLGVSLGRTPVSADQLMAELLAWVVALATRQEGAPPEVVAVTHPANWGPYKLETMQGVLDLAGQSDAVLLPEPEAAAIHYANREHLAAGETVAVYDLGGGTFDAAILRRTSTGFEILGRPQGVERLGGIDLDEAIWLWVQDELAEELEGVDSTDPTVLSDLVRLRADCSQAKIVLSGDTSAEIFVRVGPIARHLRLTRDEYEVLVIPTLRPTVTALKRALSSADVAVEDLTQVLLVGGASRTPVVHRLVSEALRRPIAVDADPKASTALGAAYHAATLFDNGHDRSRPPEAEPEFVPPPEPPPAAQELAPVPSQPQQAAPPQPQPQPPPPRPQPQPQPQRQAQPPPQRVRTAPQAADSYSSRKGGVLVLIALLAIVGAVIGYVLLSNDPASAPQVADQSPQQPSSESITDGSAATSIPDDRSSESITDGSAATSIPDDPGTRSTVDASSEVATVPVAPQPLTSFHHNGRLYVAHHDSTAISVIDVTTEQVVGSVEVGAHARYFAAIGTTIYVLRSGDGIGSGRIDEFDVISVVDATTNTLVAEIELGQQPKGILSANGSIYALTFSPGTVAVIDPLTNTVVEIVTGLSLPQEFVAVGGSLYVSSAFDESVTVIDLASNEITATIDIGSGAHDLLPVGDLLYVLSKFDARLTAIDLKTHTVSTVITLETDGSAVAMVETGGTIYVSVGSGNPLLTSLDATLTSVDAATATVIASLDYQGTFIDAAVAGGRVFFANPSLDLVDVLSPASGAIVEQIPVGEFPRTVVEGGGLIFVTDLDSATISIIKPS
nr:hypothetical protein [uncultured bacterium]